MAKIVFIVLGQKYSFQEFFITVTDLSGDFRCGYSSYFIQNVYVILKNINLSKIMFLGFSTVS